MLTNHYYLKESSVIKKITESKMMDSEDINLIIPEIKNDKIIGAYFNICHGFFSTIKYINYYELIDLVLLLDIYPLNNLKMETIEYYLCEKYVKNKKIDEFLEQICVSYKLRHLLACLYNYRQ